MGIIKGTLKKALPMVGAGFALYDGIKGGIDVFKANRAAGGGFLSSFGKASAVAGTGAIGAAVSMVPGAGLLGPIVATATTSAVKAAMMSTIDAPKQDIVVNVNDKEAMRIAAGEVQAANARSNGMDLTTNIVGAPDTTTDW